MLAIVLGLLSSLSFALAHILVNRGLSGMDYFTGVMVNVIVNTLLLWVSLAFLPGVSEIWQPANLVFVASGLLVPGFARFFIYRGIERLGASVSSCLISSAPVFAILSA
ncbi:MAG: EamA family transporter, partial [Deltaproteobacteria bacterium]|nr:EamA family transporter [Deltaproteobacteria bacterium]